MFGLRKEKGKIYATQDGKCVSLDKVPDPVFADKLLGDGVAIIPNSDIVKSPVNGTVEQVFDTLHAYSVKSDDGLEILVHIGLNTVELKGEGFNAQVKKGDKVKVGDTLCTADIDLIKSRGYELFTPIVITNMDEIKNCDCIQGKTVSGETVVFEYSK